MVRAGGFVALSGLGWLFDLALFWALAGGLSFAPGLANLASATAAAMAVYALSSWLVFGARTPAKQGFAVYFLYTEANIMLFAAIIQGAAALIVGLDLMESLALAGLVAKVAVTPLSLGCNFFVARYLATRTWSR
jgi:putative flippase GtrA